MLKKIALLLILALALLPLAACGENTAPTQEPVVTPTQEPEISPESDITSDSSEIEDSGENNDDDRNEGENDDTIDDRDEISEIIEDSNILTVGDTATIGNWEVTLISAEFSDEVITHNSFFETSEDEKFMYTVLTVANLGTTPRRFYDRWFDGNVTTRIIYNDSFTFNPIELIGYDNEIRREIINPLTSLTGSIIFDVARIAAEDLDGSLILEFVYQRETVRFRIR